MKFEVSDWVQAKTKNGELIHGFIDFVDEPQRIVNVFVVKSDNEDSVGKLAAVREQWLRKLPVNSLDDAGQIQSLIDIALLTRDKEWFNELSDKLITLSKHENKQKKYSIPYPSSTNRMGYPV